jgi:very-short-patch-repair endonuclease
VTKIERTMRLVALAGRQLGLFTRGQLRALGYSDGEIDHRVQRGDFIAADFGVYRGATTPPSSDQRLLAACLAGPAVASHRAAAARWGLPGFDPDIVEITSLRHRRRKTADVIWHESVRLDDSECTTLGHIPVTLPTRTILDLGSVVDEPTLLRALDDALRRKLTSMLGLRIELESWGDQRRGSGVVRRALAHRIDEPVPESVLETEFDELVRESVLPRPMRQWLVRDETGVPIARVDFAYPDAALVIEIDGIAYHDGAIERERDRTRDTKLASLGLRVQRFTARDIRRRPKWVTEQITRALAPRPASLDPVYQGERRNQR